MPSQSLSSSFGSISAVVGRNVLTPLSAEEIIKSTSLWQKSEEVGKRGMRNAFLDGRIHTSNAIAKEVVEILTPIAASLGKPAPVLVEKRVDSTCTNFYITVAAPVLIAARKSSPHPRRSPRVIKETPVGVEAARLQYP